MAADPIVKREFNSKIADQKKEISELEKDVAAYKSAYAKNKKLKPYFHLGITARYLMQINTYMDMNDLSETMLNIKNNSFLDLAKKLIAKIFSELDQVVTMRQGETINFNAKHLAKIRRFDPRKRANLLKHTRRSIDRLVKSYGENTKWKWSFPELYKKLAIVAKNIVDYREKQRMRDPREEFFYDRDNLLELTKEYLMNASDRSRNKYELGGKSSNDLVAAIKLLEDLRKICMVMGDSDLASKSQAGIEAYKARLEKEDDKPKKKVATKGKKKKKK